jgi:acetyl esterase/lipase
MADRPFIKFRFEFSPGFDCWGSARWLFMSSISVNRDISYCTKADGSRDTERELDFYFPLNGAETSPVLLFVHGGAWRTGDKAEHSKLAENLAKQGFTVAVNNYRLVLVVAYYTSLDMLLNH